VLFAGLLVGFWLAEVFPEDPKSKLAQSLLFWDFVYTFGCCTVFEEEVNPKLKSKGLYNIGDTFEQEILPFSFSSIF